MTITGYENTPKNLIRLFPLSLSTLSVFVNYAKKALH